MEREQIFERRQKRYEEIEARYEKKYIVYSRLRVVIFVLGAVAAVFYANERNGTAVAICVAVFTLLFLLVVKRHNLIAYRRDISRILKEINEQESLRLML